MSHLILVRHGQSEWNLQKKFTGWVAVELTPNGTGEVSVGSGAASGKITSNGRGKVFSIAILIIRNEILKNINHQGFLF